MAVLAGGLLWQFWPQGSSSARSDTAKSFVGRREQAVALLKDNLARHPGDRDTLIGLVSMGSVRADLTFALDFAERQNRAAPDDRALANAIGALRR